MNLTTHSEPQVTILVSPRERFSIARDSLESIYEHTQIPFQLVYVDGGSPEKLRHHLAAAAHTKGFHLIRTNHYLSPNHARNLGLQCVRTPYVVFIDNDVIVSPGWLEALLSCAEDTGAAVVSPLVCQGTPLHTEVHCAGGESGVIVEEKNGTPRRRILEKIYRQGRQIEDIRDELYRKPTGLAEFHCMMVRTAIFEQIGLLDAQLLNTKEHVDLCIQVAQAGGSIYLEPASVVSYVTEVPLEFSDMPYYMLRWSDAWEMASLKRLQEKWNLTEDDYFKHRYSRLGWRRDMAILQPLTRQVPRGRRVVSKVLRRADKVLNRYLSDRYARKHLPSLSQASEKIPSLSSNSV